MSTLFPPLRAPKNSTFVLLNSLLYLPLRGSSIRQLFNRTRMQLVSLFAPRLALRQALNMFITPPRFAHTRQENQLHAQARPIDVPTPDGRIAAWAIGDARLPAVILCHGWGGRGAQLRSFVAPLNQAGFQVVLFDHIGHGHSDGQQAALVDFWRGLEAVWDTLIDRGVAVHGMVSHSLGGAAVGSVLRRSLNRRHIAAPMPRVVLIAPPASLIRYSHMFARYLGISERVRRAMQWRFEHRYGVAWEEFELPHSVANIKAPALFIHDRDDRETKLAGSIALATTWPDARLRTTVGLGHRRILRDQSVIQNTVDFLTNQVEFQRPATLYADRPAPLY